MAEGHHIIPVWFFVGLLLLTYGVLILGSGIYHLSDPPTTVLGNLRPALWWGGLLLILGGVFLYLFRPRKA